MYERIRNLREDKDLSQQDMADYLHCTQVCYSNYENGKRDIPTAVLIALAEFHHTSVDYLLGRTPEKSPIRRSKMSTPERRFGGAVGYWKRMRQ